MSKINILDSKIYNRIAAGEVVERPRSIVKELVENSLDAGATEITVDIEDGGIARISVTDNGCGVGSDDLIKAFLPHATSKISVASDLDCLETLGFRGEALASIAAVSRITMTSRTRSDVLGRFVTVNGGEFPVGIGTSLGENTKKSTDLMDGVGFDSESVECGECGAPFGTSVLVANLFDNVPARKKFLGTPRVEEGEITSLMARLILAASDVSIKYVANGKTVYHSGGKGLRDAIFAVYGIDTLKNLCEISADHPDIKVYGFVSRPGFARHSRAFQTLVVNGRYVTDSDVSNAVYVCFKDYLMVRQYPMYVLFVDLPPDMADVNIHPAKMQVRFANQKRVLSVLKNAINTALYGESLSARTLFASPVHNAPPAAKISTADAEATIVSLGGEGVSANSEVNNKPSKTLNSATSSLPTDNGLTNKGRTTCESEENEPINKESLRYGGGLKIPQPSASTSCIMAERPFSAILAGSLADNNSASNSFSIGFAVENDGGDSRLASGNTSEKVAGNSTPNITNDFVHDKLDDNESDTTKFSSPQTLCAGEGIKRLGKLFNTYILLEIGNDFYMIDQHAAHERLIFDRLYAQAESGAALSQPLLLPYGFTLCEDDSLLVDESMAELACCGVSVEKRYAGYYELCAVPLISAGLSEPVFVAALLEMLKDNRLSAARFVREKIISAACKAAVKGEDDLSDSEVDAILVSMSKSDAVSCPHGRPAVLKIPRAEVEKWFCRRA